MDIAAGDITFRFYSKLTGWDGGDSYGQQAADEAKEYTFNENGYFTNPEGEFVKGKGSWTFNGYPGGPLQMTVDMNQMKVEFQILSE